MTTASRSKSAAQAHAKAVQISREDMARFLDEKLGTSLLALTVGVSPRTVRRWLERGSVTPRSNDAVERRLRAAYQVFDLLQNAEAAPTVRAWFMGMNPQLDDLSPAEAIAADSHREVMSAARAFLAGG